MNKETLNYKNLLHYRSKVTQESIYKMLEDMKNLLEKQNLEINGPIISTTYDTIIEDNEIFFDMEYFIPVKHPERLLKNDKYKIKDELLLVNCIKETYKGSIMYVSNEIEKFMKNLEPYKDKLLSTVYTVNLNQIKSDRDLLEVELYISINPNII